jgi:hypothetical protein
MENTLSGTFFYDEIRTNIYTKTFSAHGHCSALVQCHLLIEFR